MDAATLAFHIVVGLVVIALVFDFLNGLHDAANSIATVVSTRVLRPQTAVLWAAFFNFIAFAVFGLHVAHTLGTGIVSPGVVDAAVIFGALGGAIAWNVITWALGLPSSSSHALIGGFVGAGVAKAGWTAIEFGGLGPTAIGIVLSPLLGFALAQLLMLIVRWATLRATPYAVDRRFRVLQLISAALYSLGHGGNDAQKTMGIIAVLLYSQGLLGATFHVPFWVIMAAHASLAFGTMMGGWRIVKTMGMRITKLRPVGGFCAETAGAVTLIGTALAGIPVSTTQTITGSIMGVGSLQRFSAVRWGVAGRILWAWILTIPASALVAAATWLLLRLLGV